MFYSHLITAKTQFKIKMMKIKRWQCYRACPNVALLMCILEQAGVRTDDDSVKKIAEGGEYRKQFFILRNESVYKDISRGDIRGEERGGRQMLIQHF